MKANYEKCLKFTLAFEGGYVNHPKDPGGATNFGITQKVYDGYRDGIGKPRQSVKKIAKPEYMAIYKMQYWDAVKGDRLPVGIDLVVFDYAVNSGVSRAVRAVQKVLNNPALLPPTGGVDQDGHLGLATEKAIQEAYATDEEKFIILYCEDRYAFVRKLRTWSTFGKGWTRRIMGNRLGAQEADIGVVDVALAMARGDTPPKVVVSEEQAKITGGKADTADVKIEATAEGAASGTATVGGAGVAVAKTGVSAYLSDTVVSLGETAGFTKEQIEPYIGYSQWLLYAFIALGLFGIVGMVAVRMKKQKEGSVEA